MNDLVREFLEAHSQYHATLKHMPKYTKDSRRLRKFIKYYRHSQMKQKTKLSFQLNLDEEDLKITRKLESTEKPKKKSEDKVQKTKVPAEFIKRIIKLGFDKKDAAQLYESKDDWTGMNSGGRVQCTAKGCSFATDLSSNALVEHVRTVHGWRDHPCTGGNCDYVGLGIDIFTSECSQ